MTNSHKIHIPAVFLPDAEARIAKLAKAAKRCKAAEPTLTVIDRYEKYETSVVWLVIEITETFAQIPDWKFVATIEHLSDEDALVRVSPQAADEVNATDLYDLPNKCDHCQTVRQRNTTYIFKHLTDGRQIQVGSTCIKDYFGHHLNLPYYDDVADALSDFENYGSGGGGGRDHIPVRRWLTYAMQAIETFGYRKTSMDDPTKVTMQSLARPLPQSELPNRVVTLTAENLAEIDEVLEWLLNIEADNDYHRNLHMVVKYDLGDSKYIGLIASMIPAYRYHKGLILRREQMEAEIKTPVITGAEVEISGVIVKTDLHTNDYGVRSVMTVKDDRGFLVWGTVPAKIDGVRKGDRVTFTASVEASNTDECFGFFKRPKKATARLAENAE